MNSINLSKEFKDIVLVAKQENTSVVLLDKQTESEYLKSAISFAKSNGVELKYELHSHHANHQAKASV